MSISTKKCDVCNQYSPDSQLWWGYRAQHSEFGIRNTLYLFYFMFVALWSVKVLDVLLVFLSSHSLVLSIPVLSTPVLNFFIKLIYNESTQHKMTLYPPSFDSPRCFNKGNCFIKYLGECLMQHSTIVHLRLYSLIFLPILLHSTHPRSTCF